jgi:porphobilinogen synthase
MVAETALRPAELVLPVFIKEGLADPQPIGSMPGVVQHTRESLRKAASAAVEAGVGGIIVFGIPADRTASAAAPTTPRASPRSRSPTSGPRSATTW